MKRLMSFKAVKRFLSVLLSVAVFVLEIPQFAMTSYAEDTLLSFEDYHLTIDVFEGDYDTQNHVLVTPTCDHISGGDPTIEYSVDGGSTWTENISAVTERNAGEYEIYVRLSHTGFQTYTSEKLTAKINKLNITGITLEGPDTIVYDANQNQPLVWINGYIPNTDTVTWTVNGTDTGENTIPVATGAGTYTVELTIERANYNTFTDTVTTEVVLPEIQLGSLRVSGYEGIYDGNAHNAVTVENAGSYSLLYQLDTDGDGLCDSDPSSWNSTIPTVTDAGSYIVWVKATKTNFNDKEVSVSPASSAVAPYNVYIGKASQSFAFDNFTGDSSELGLNITQMNAGYECNFAATDSAQLVTGSTITYSIVLDSEDSGIAEIDSDTGMLTITGPGSVTVKATLSGDANYDSCTIEHTIYISAVRASQSDYIYFDEDLITYTLGNTAGIPSNPATKTYRNRDWGSITYSITDSDDIGLSIDGSGTVRVSDYAKLISNLEDNDGTIDVTVVANKAEYKRWWWTMYPADRASYTLRISLADIPASAYSVYSVNDEETALTGGNGNNGWYNTPVIIKPAEDYEILRAENISGSSLSFSSEVILGATADGTAMDQGDNEYIVYLRDTTTGEITGRVVLDVNKIDTVVPGSLNILFPETTSQNNVNYYGDSVTVRFRAYDATSGVDHFEWEYTREDGASSSNLDEDNGTVSAREDTAGAGYYYGELTLPKDQADQLRGNIRIVAVDKAGNRSVAYTDTGLFVVDTLSPTRTVEYGLKDEKAVEQVIDSKHYFSGDVVFTFKITESNFYGSDVVITVTKNGVASRVTNLSWEATGKNDEYKAVLTLSEDGEYIVSMEYTDRSGKEMTSFESEVIVIDSVAPVMSDAEFSSPDKTVNGTAYYKGSVTVQFRINEINFFEEDVHIALKNQSDELKEVTATWTDAGNGSYTGTVTLEASANHSYDGEYVFIINYTDRSGNVMTEYVSGKKIIDTTAPVISVKYDIANPVYTATDSENNQRRYYNARLTATVTITERNFSAEDVKYTIIAKDVSGALLDAKALFSVSGWTRSGDNNTMVITYPGDANYTFDIEYIDLALNAAEDYSAEHFTVDTTPPTDLRISYSVPVSETVLDTVPVSYYNATATVTITATDNISGINFMQYSCIGADLVSTVNSERAGVIVDSSGIVRSEGGKVGTVQFDLPGNVLGAGGQFNGNISFYATDRASNDSAALLDGNRIIVDSIHPTIDVNYNVPAQVKNGISYYAGNINATVTIHEANFHSEDVNVSVIRNGVEQVVAVNWNDNSPDVHVGTFTLTDDGDYTIGVGYSDRSGNVMQDYVSGRLTIDTQIEAATITVNGLEADGVAFKEDVVPSVVFEDINLDSYEIKLFRTNYSEKNVDVTNLFIGNSVSAEGNTIRIDMDPFDKVQDNDGIYILKTYIVDKSGNSAERNITFTVNRFGSVYEYDEYLMCLISDGGAYVQSVESNLIIDEYNADKLLTNSLDIIISRDGKPLENIVYGVTPTINDTVAVGAKGWYQYTYTIDKSNFAYDGVYKISISSKDATGNSPENNNYKEKIIVFRVDSTVPEITSISGLERRIINATDQEVKYSIYDTIGLASVVVYVDGNAAYDISDFSDDPNNYSGSFVLHESSNVQKVCFVVTDKAGNITDTNSVEFTSAYVFNPEITVSTNFFVRWFANKLMFFGTIGAGLALIVSGTACVAGIRKRRRYR